MVKDERSVIVLNECMLKNNKFQKEWHGATKSLILSLLYSVLLLFKTYTSGQHSGEATHAEFLR